MRKKEELRRTMSNYHQGRGFGLFSTTPHSLSLTLISTEQTTSNLFAFIDKILPDNEKKPSFNMNFVFKVSYK